MFCFVFPARRYFTISKYISDTYCPFVMWQIWYLNVEGRHRIGAASATINDSCKQHCRRHCCESPIRIQASDQGFPPRSHFHHLVRRNVRIRSSLFFCLSKCRSTVFTSPVFLANVCRSPNIPTHMRWLKCPQNSVVACSPHARSRSVGFERPHGQQQQQQARSKQHNAPRPAT